MSKKTIADLNLSGKRILIRVDFNVPLDEKGRITDDSRIQKSIPTIRYALTHQGKVILMSHLGRPDGRRDPKYSLRSAAVRLTELLGLTVQFFEDCQGSEVEEKSRSLQPGQVLLLENLRFYPEEEKNNAEFARNLARLGDIFINDAFASAHRAHASTEGIARFLPSAAGFLLAREIEYFEKVLGGAERPFVSVLGGAKVSDKIKIIGNLLGKMDTLLIGGAMAYPFCRVKGHAIGNSKYEAGSEATARQILDQAMQKQVSVTLPVDHVVAEKLEKKARYRVVDEEIPPGWMGLDIGPKTVDAFKRALSKAKTVLWNGPLGVCEVSPFDRGSREIAEYLGSLKTTSIIGGGDTASAIHQFGLEEKMSHVSTGGGASLEYLEGKVLPGIAALSGNVPRLAGTGAERGPLS